MYSIHYLIDYFQNVKKSLTDSVFTDQDLNKMGHSYIDAQTTFAKMLVDNSTKMCKYYVDKQASLWRSPK